MKGKRQTRVILLMTIQPTILKTFVLAVVLIL
jgi:hypothetical protein